MRKIRIDINNVSLRKRTINDRKMKEFESSFGGRTGGTCNGLDAKSESDRIKERCSTSDLWSIINTK